MRILSAMLCLLAAIPSRAWACTSCGAGDPSIAVAGTEKPVKGRIRFSADTSYRFTTTADPGGGNWRDEHLVLSPAIAWTPDRHIVLTAVLPLAMAAERAPNLGWERGFGLGDASIGARVVALRHDGHVDHLGGVSLGLELPTGLRVRRDGVPTSQPTQTGTGAWTPTLGLWYGLYGSVGSMFTSVTGRYSSVGWDEVRPGAGIVATLSGQVQPIPEFAPRLAVDARWLAPDQLAGVDEAGTGGWLVAVDPGIAVSPGRDVVITASVGVPFAQGGSSEREGPSPRVGVSVDL